MEHTTTQIHSSAVDGRYEFASEYHVHNGVVQVLNDLIRTLLDT